MIKSLARRISQYNSKYKFKFNLFQARHGFLNHLNWEGIKVIFIISTGRTGTKFLADFFNRFENIEARHEPKPNFLSLGNNYAEGKISSNIAQEIIATDRRIVLNELYKMNAKIYIESNNRLFSLIPVLRNTFPNCKFLHIVRDGRDVVRSGMGRGWYEPNDFPRIKATDFPDDPYFKEWEKMSRFEKICWWWQKKDSFIYESVRGKEDSITVKFEDIFDPDKKYKGIKNIIDFINIDINFTNDFKDLMKQKVNDSKSYAIPYWKEWGSDLKNQFIKIAGKHMTNYGYLDKKMEW